MGQFRPPDDWGCNVSISPHEAKRTWLQHKGYDFDGTFWWKILLDKKRTCRRDHKDGTIKKGDVYYVQTIRFIEDETGKTELAHHKGKSYKVLSYSPFVRLPVNEA